MRFATVLLVAIVLMMMVELSETRGRIGRSIDRDLDLEGPAQNLKSPSTRQSKPPQFAPR